jgi:hypothetical protein
MKFWYGSGSESVNPYLSLMDPYTDPAIFVSDLQNKKLFLRYFAHYFLKVPTFTSFFKDKEVTKQ